MQLKLVKDALRLSREFGNCHFDFNLNLEVGSELTRLSVKNLDWAIDYMFVFNHINPMCSLYYDINTTNTIGTRYLIYSNFGDMVSTTFLINSIIRIKLNRYGIGVKIPEVKSDEWVLKSIDRRLHGQFLENNFITKNLVFTNIRDLSKYFASNESC